MPGRPAICNLWLFSSIRFEDLEERVRLFPPETFIVRSDEDSDVNTICCCELVVEQVKVEEDLDAMLAVPVNASDSANNGHSIAMIARATIVFELILGHDR